MLSSTTIAYENNLLLAAILCLLLVILFVLLLHIYARWLLAEGHLCRTSIVGVFGRTPHLRRSHTVSSTTYTYDITSLSSCSYQTKGLDLTVIDLIPTFVYGPVSEGRSGEGFKGVALECAICLSMFEEGEVGRSLPRCSHAFHMECIDMWLFSHSTCPICRAQVVMEGDVSQKSETASGEGTDGAAEDPAAEEHLLVDDDTNQTDEAAVVMNRDNRLNNDQVLVEIMGIDADSEDENVGSRDYPMLDCSLRRMLSRNRSEKSFNPSSASIVQVV